jgi:hypothetical protein
MLCGDQSRVLATCHQSQTEFGAQQALARTVGESAGELFVRAVAVATVLGFAPIALWGMRLFGLGIPDFNRPGQIRLSEIYRQKREHIDAHHIGQSFLNYTKFPTTFDGSPPSEAFGEGPPLDPIAGPAVTRRTPNRRKGPWGLSLSETQIEHVDGVARPRSATNARALFGRHDADRRIQRRCILTSL